MQCPILAHSVIILRRGGLDAFGGNADINQQAFVTFHETPP
jgi:hypothetical protein